MDGSAYGDDEEDDEWAGDDNTWNEEAEPEDENDAKDESNAYLEFLNEEVTMIVPTANFTTMLTSYRHKNSRTWMIMIQMMS